MGPRNLSALIPPAAGIFCYDRLRGRRGRRVLDALGNGSEESKHSGLITGAVVGRAWIVSLPFMAVGTGLLGLIGVANLAAAAAGKVPAI